MFTSPASFYVYIMRSFSGAALTSLAITKKPQNYKLSAQKMFGMSHTTGPGRATAAAALVATVLYCVCVVPAGGTHVYGHQPSTNLDNLVGTVCQVPFGFLPLTCGDYELLEERSEPVPLFKYG